MKKKFCFLVILTSTGILFLNSCRHEALFPNGGGGIIMPPQTTCSADSVYFINDVMPLIGSKCNMSGCHDDASHADGVVLTSYSKIMKYVKAGDAAGSKLYKVIIKTNNDRMPPPPMPPLTATQKSLIEKWINQGAKNNNCTGRCDTAVFTYSGSVKPIMDNKCVGCHNPSNLGGNIDLSTHAAVKVVALNGKLYGSVAHQAGYSPMPKNSLKLSDCEITQIQKWISAGSLNN